MRFIRSRFFYLNRRWLFAASTVFILGTLWLLNVNFHNQNIPMVDSSRHLPLLYWYHRSSYPQAYRNNSCTRAPSPRRIEHASPYWQVVRSPVGNVIASSAFWDDRFGTSAVRVLVYSDLTELPEFYCQLWYYNRNDPVIVHARDTYAWRDEDIQPDEFEDDDEEEKPKAGPIETIVEPHVLSCIIPNRSLAPAAVSLVTDTCAGATNMLNVQGAAIEESIKQQLPGIWTGADQRRDVLEAKGVCVCAFLPPHSRDVSARVAEWIELLKHFGVETIYLYITMAHSNVRRVIDHYQWNGLVDVTYFSVPFAGHADYHSKKYSQGVMKLGNRKKQQVIYNDCLYRAIGWHRWIVPLRLDDIIVPIRDGSLVKLAERELQESLETPDALSFKTYWFTPRASEATDPIELKMVDHEWRTNEQSGDEWHTRCMNRIDTMLIIHEYRPLWCGGGTIKLSDGNILERGSKKHLCQVIQVDPDAARVHAYGATCKKCDNLIRDTVLQRWRHVSKETEDLLRVLTRD